MSSGTRLIGATACEGDQSAAPRDNRWRSLHWHGAPPADAGRFACHAVQRSASRVPESCALPLFRLKGARLQNVHAIPYRRSASCPFGEADAERTSIGLGRSGAARVDAPESAGQVETPGVLLYNCTGMEIVVDTSVIIAVLVREPHRAALVQATASADLLAPPSVHWEVGNAFSAMFKRGRLTLRAARLALEAYRQIPIRFSDIRPGSGARSGSELQSLRIRCLRPRLRHAASLRVALSRSRVGDRCRPCGNQNIGDTTVRVCTFSEARQKFAALLERARREGAVR